MTDHLRTLLVANRGEIALRIFRAARSLGIETVAIRSEDDAGSLHVRRADRVAVLPGVGPAAYLDVDAVVAAARETGADGIHPGYGFLSESAAFASACRKAGVTFVGPSPDVLDAFGDKGRARQLAEEHAVPLLPGTVGPTSLDQMVDFMAGRAGGGTPDAAVMVKAVAGGGGRGVRVVRNAGDLPRAVEECRAEALAAFGVGDLYIERLLTGAHHVEVQVVGDGTGAVAHLWDRDCSVQRRHQKLIEIAPSSLLAAGPRSEMLAAAVRLTSAVQLRGLATVEFLALPDGSFFFLEVNPRLQVEHTVTEQVLGLDLVSTQLRLAQGATLADLGLEQADVPTPVGSAIQVRINAESVRGDGRIAPAIGTVTGFELPTGAGVRVDSSGYPGMQTNPRFDSLLAKIVVHDRAGFPGAVRLASEALEETTISGVATNVALQRAVLEHPDFVAGTCDTAWGDRMLGSLAARAQELEQLAEVRSGAPQQAPAPADARWADDARAVQAGVGGVVTSVEVSPGQLVPAGTTLLVLEAMKMQHPVLADTSGTVDAVLVDVGATVTEGDVVALLDAADSTEDVVTAGAAALDPDHVRADLAALRLRQAKLLDAARPEAVGKRHKLGMRTARENVAAVTDDGLLVEYGGLAVAARRSQVPLAELEARTPADGIITGLGRVNGDLFPADRSTCAVLAYDYTVLAGTQGYYSHQKTDRLLDVARTRGYPVVLFAEGGGGRPGDTDSNTVAGLHYRTFGLMGALSGRVPTVGIAAGRCFAGNAALLGTCDVVIATENSTIGMGGPAMIEGGGLGTFAPEDVGPIGVQRRNGVVDIVVADEAEATDTARRYLSYFQGPLADHEAADQRLLRHLIPENRKRVYDVRAVLETLFDIGSLLELRSGFGPGVITALARIEGSPVGVIANNPAVLGGAIDADGADKLARFLQLCDAFAIPVVSLCDTPGFMVGPESEKQATVRHFARLFVLSGHLTVPMVTVVLRKAYGLGALGMAAGGFHNPSMTVAWPTGEFGGMGLEGAVRLAAKNHLAAIEDPVERQRQFDEMVALAYERGSAVNAAAHLEIDDVIDPADTRRVISAALLAQPGPPRDGWANSRRSAGVDTW